MNTLIEIKRNALNDLKIVGDIQQLNILLEGIHSNEFILGVCDYIVNFERHKLGIETSIGRKNAHKLFKAGKIFVIKRKGNVGYILKCQKDGGSYCCFGTEFTDLQSSSDFVFADTFEQAVDGYIAMKSKQLEMQDLTEQKQVNEIDILTIDESYQAKILELERNLKFAENQIKSQILDIDTLTEQIKQLQSNYLHACENYKQKDLQCETLIAENKNLIKTDTILQQQICNYENTTKTLVEENRKLKIDLEARPPIWANATLPKISEGTLEKLVIAYGNSKKTANTFDSWLYNCARDSVTLSEIKKFF